MECPKNLTKKFLYPWRVQKQGNDEAWISCSFDSRPVRLSPSTATTRKTQGMLITSIGFYLNRSICELIQSGLRNWQRSELFLRGSVSWGHGFLLAVNHCTSPPLLGGAALPSHDSATQATEQDSTLRAKGGRARGMKVHSTSFHITSTHSTCAAHFMC